MPDLTKLTKPEIENLCKQMAPKDIRSYFQKFPKGFTRIRPGFRPTSLSDEDAISLIIRHSDKPFIWSYIENTVKIWLSEIESYIEDTVQKGSSPEEALLQAMPQSVFAENAELYLSLTDAKYSPEYVLLLILKQDLPVPQLDGIVSLMVDIICTTGKTVKISGESKAREEVCRRFLALNDIHIRYVFDRMKEETNVVQYPRGYLLARLYEAKDVMDTYYQIRVNHDMNTVNN